MMWKNLLIFAGGLTAAGFATAALENKGAHKGLLRKGAVQATAACMKVGDVVAGATQDVIDKARDLTAEARRQAKIDAVVNARMSELKEQVVAEAEQKVDAAAH